MKKCVFKNEYGDECKIQPVKILVDHQKISNDRYDIIYEKCMGEKECPIGRIQQKLRYHLMDGAWKE